jgi:uncharacterized protein YbaP (TraB family)
LGKTTLKTMKKLISKKIGFVMFLLLVGTSVVNAQVPEAKGVLWRVSGNGLEKDSYVFGTMHLICEDDYFMSDEAKAAIQQADEVVLELDMDDPQMMVKMQQLSVDPKMRNIKDDLTEEEVVIVDKFLNDNFGQTLAQIGILKPFPLTSMVLVKAYECENTKQYEAEIMNLAHEAGLDLKGLETVEFQFGALDNFSRDEQIASFVRQVKNPEAVTLLLDKMVDTYKKQDLSALYKIMEDYEEFENFNQIMLADRNANWIPKIEEYAKKGSAFIAVGAGHLAGEKGVIALLRAKGYKVEAVN